jgi:hypothetical protein
MSVGGESRLAQLLPTRYSLLTIRFSPIRSYDIHP